MTVPRKNLVGQKFGMLTVLAQANDHITRGGLHKTAWECACECGKHIIATGSNLRTGNTQSCGCTRSESQKTHGERHTRLYRIWCNIKSRCYNANSRVYDGYGYRGITMCDEWKEHYEAFRDWSYAHGYSDDLTIDRIDNDGNYCPENCRWTDAKTQANNRRSSRYVVIDGESKSLAAWADELGYSRSIFHARAKLKGTTVEEQVVELAKHHRKIA